MLGAGSKMSCDGYAVFIDDPGARPYGSHGHALDACWQGSGGFALAQERPIWD